MNCILAVANSNRKDFSIYTYLYSHIFGGVIIQNFRLILLFIVRAIWRKHRLFSLFNLKNN